MQQGGTVLFDTRDQFANGIGADSASPATERLRDILGNLNVPPLEPVPSDHVLTKSFYILPDFPGRLPASPPRVEASLDRRPAVAARAVGPDAAHLCTARRRQHHDVHADRQLQIRSGACPCAARTA